MASRDARGYCAEAFNATSALAEALADGGASIFDWIAVLCQPSIWVSCYCSILLHTRSVLTDTLKKGIFVGRSIQYFLQYLYMRKRQRALRSTIVDEDHPHQSP